MNREEVLETLSGGLSDTERRLNTRILSASATEAFERRMTDRIGADAVDYL